MNTFKFLLYNFFLHSLFGLCLIYSRESFDKSFANFSVSDIVRAIVLIMIMVSYFWLVTDDLHKMFEDIPPKRKILIKVVSFFVSMFTIGFLLSVYFDFLSP